MEKLVLPAAEEAESIWTKKLGFRKMRDEQVSELLDLFTWLPTWNLLLVFQMLNVHSLTVAYCSLSYQNI